MKLKTYFDGLPRGSAADLASALSIHPVYLSQIARNDGGRVPSAELAVAIERATSGAVTRKDLRPDDWHLIWPELIGTEGAPSIEAKAA